MSGGASSSGIVYEIPRGTTTIAVVASFNGANGASPFTGVTLDTNGNLFGTTTGNGYGTVYEIPIGSTLIVTVGKFNGNNGGVPDGSITIDGRGDLFGTTSEYGNNNAGTVFELTPTPPNLSFNLPPLSTNAGSILDGATGVQVNVLYPIGSGMATRLTTSRSP